MLERIRIQGFKSLVDVDVKLSPLVVVLGPNTAGKSNFLEALVLLSRIVTERTLAQAFSGNIRGYPVEAFTLPAGGLPDLLKQDETRMRLEADLAHGEGEEATRLRYAVEVGVQPASGKLWVADEYLATLNRSGEPKGSQQPRIVRIDDKLVIRHRGGPGRGQEETLGLHHSLASDLHFSGDRFPELDALRAEVGSWRSYYLDPRKAMREEQTPSMTPDIGERGEAIASFLYRLHNDDEHKARFHAIGRTLRTLIDVDSLGVALAPQRGTLDLQVMQRGVAFSSRIVSEGTLRILALCAVALNPWSPRLVAFEEPENGVHPRRIDAIAGLLARMLKSGPGQVIVTTHSPRLAAQVAGLRTRPELAGKITLLRAIPMSDRTRFEPLRLDLPLLEDTDIDAALSLSTEADRFEQLFARGWLDA